MSSDTSKIHLDFIYGRVNNNNELILLDGQQRMTTLFLLHWYLSLGKLTEEQKGILSKFKYATRTNTEDFCFKLVKENLEEKNIINPKDVEKPTISKKITNSKWFFLSWKRDPTISAMLNMLEHIENIFGKPDFSLFKNLISEDTCPVTFEFLPLERFGLEDELYIKMNARGKPLTNFENFKAKFSEYVDDAMKLKLDNEWLDIFWNFEKKNDSPSSKNADEKYFNFFENITLCFFLENQSLEKKEDFDLFECYDKIYSTQIFIMNINAVLDALVDYNDNNNYFNDILISDPSPTYWQRARFYALSCFFIEHGKVIKENKCIFESWMRICRNLINNTIHDDISDLEKSIKSIKKLTTEMDNIYEFFDKYLKTDKLPADFFDKAQQKEEIIKSDLLLNKNQLWENLILGIESNSYFDGQIGFILRFSKKDNMYDDKLFARYSKILNELFSTYKENFDFLFQRALFTIGDYLAPFSSAKSFCTFDEGLRAKNDHWRKVFDHTERSNYLKQLLDKIGDKNIQKCLEKIIDNYRYDEKDWKSHFIKEGKDNKAKDNNGATVFKHCRNGQIRILDGEIITLSQGGIYSQKWSSCAELYTYVYYLKYLSGKDDNVCPFTKTHYWNSTHPCACIDTWEKGIYDDYDLTMDILHDTDGYSLIVKDRDGKDLPKNIRSALNKSNFKKDGKEYAIYPGKVSFDDLDKTIHKILKNLAK
ncbi:MAG: hypothetical protein Ta2F_17470 [Termitinemataceae bacterium]|nr:MAG: hypothetical protein Ta2F_17470 [Termitinemataceae bacterium]